jgi:hypothetical protein
MELTEVAHAVQSSALSAPTLGPVGLDLSCLCGIVKGLLPVSQ